MKATVLVREDAGASPHPGSAAPPEPADSSSISERGLTTGTVAHVGKERSVSGRPLRRQPPQGGKVRPEPLLHPVKGDDPSGSGTWLQATAR